MDAACDQAGEVGHVDEKVGTDLVGDLPHAGEIPVARVGATAADDDLRLLAHGQGLKLVVVDDLSIAANLVGDDSVELAREVELVAVGQMAAVGQVKAEKGVAGLNQRHVGGGVRLRAGVGLHVGVVGAEELLGPVACDIFNDIGKLAAAVVALAGVAFRVFVGENRPCRLKHSARDEVFAGNHLQPVVLANDLMFDLRGDFWVAGKKRRVEGGRHGFIIPPHARAWVHEKASL